MATKTKRDTTLNPFPPELPTIDKAIQFRDSLVEHLNWIAEHRRDNCQYDRLAALYRRQLVSTSALIARLTAQQRAAQKEAKAA